MKRSKEIQQTNFLYLATIAFDNVFKTQILSWLNLYHQEGVKFILIKIDGLTNLFSQQKKSDYKEIKRRYAGSSKWLLLPPRKANLAAQGLFLYLYAKIKFSKKKFVIQTRTHEYYGVLERLKKNFGDKLTIIYDSRAAKAEEYRYVHLNGTKNKSDVKFLEIARKERAMVKASDVVLCVSEKLINYHLQQNKDINSNKFRLYPGNADAEIFRYDKELRQKYRSSLGIENKTVIIYSGGLSMPWHLADEMFSFYKKISSKQMGMIFLLLSRDHEEAEKLRKKHAIPAEEIKIISCDNHEVPAYLNAADAGLLLRENVPMNNVASPTKFTEYQLCGLPVIISEGVGDFSAYIQETGFGFVLKNENQEKARHFIKEALPNINRSEIAEKAVHKYAKQAVLPQMINLYQNLNGKNENSG